MTKSTKNKIFSWFQFRTFLLLAVGIMLWVGYQWWQKAFITPSAVNDSQLAAEVLADIGRRAPFDLLNVQAKVMNGNVTLIGKVRSKEEEKEILKIAGNIHGIKSVAANLQLDPALRTPDEVKQDAFLAMKIKSSIAMEEGLRVFQIKVSSHKGVISLDGEVPFEEHRTLAERVVLRISGVKKVINKITIHKKKE